MNFNGDVPGFEPEEGPYKKYQRTRPSLLQRFVAFLVDEPHVTLTPYQFRLEPRARGAGVLVLHVRERRGRVDVVLDADQVMVLEKVLGEVKR